MKSQMRRAGSIKKSCFMRFLRGDFPGSQDRKTTFNLKWGFAFLFFSLAVADAVFEIRSLLRDPIPAFEQLEVEEGYIRTEIKAKSSFRKVMVVTPRGTVGGGYPWWPCTLQSKDWTSQFEGQRAKVWYVNNRIVQLQFGDRVDDSCQYGISVRIDEEAKQTAIRSFVLDFFAFLVGVYLAVLACRQLK